MNIFSVSIPAIALQPDYYRALDAVVGLGRFGDELRGVFRRRVRSVSDEEYHGNGRDRCVRRHHTAKAQY